MGMTLKQAKEKLAAFGMSLRHRDGEYRVNFRNGSEATAYYTDDREDAVDTAMHMYETAPRGWNEVTA